METENFAMARINSVANQVITLLWIKFCLVYYGWRRRLLIALFSIALFDIDLKES